MEKRPSLAMLVVVGAEISWVEAATEGERVACGSGQSCALDSDEPSAVFQQDHTGHCMRCLGVA